MASLMVAAKVNRNGMKVTRNVMLTMTSYAPRTEVPAWPATTKTTVSSAWVRSALTGVPHRGCSRPKAAGRLRSRPAAKGMRATASSQAPTLPSAVTVISTAATGVTQSRARRAAARSTACMTPCSPVTSAAGSATSTLSVPSR